MFHFFACFRCLNFSTTSLKRHHLSFTADWRAARTETLSQAATCQKRKLSKSETTRRCTEKKRSSTQSCLQQVATVIDICAANSGERWMGSSPCCWQAIWRKKWLPSSGRFWPTPPRSFITTTQCTSYASINGFSPSTRNCCTHRPRYNATVTGEKNRPSSGLARIFAHPRPPKIWKPSASATRFPDWIGGMCYADTLQVWFPANWAAPGHSPTPAKGGWVQSGQSLMGGSDWRPWWSSSAMAWGSDQSKDAVQGV